MAEKSPTTKPPAPTDLASMIPGLKYQNLAYLGGALVLLWALVIASGSKVALGVMGVLTVALIAGGVWVWRWIQKQQSLAKLVSAARPLPALPPRSSPRTRRAAPSRTSPPRSRGRRR